MNPFAAIRWTLLAQAKPVRAVPRGLAHSGRKPARPADTDATGPPGPPGARRRRVRAGAVLPLAVAACLVPAASASAAVPSVSTGGANHVTYNSATLTGQVNPQGQGTSYYFQYGLTRSYGGQTTILNAGGGSKAVRVSAAIGGLQPLSVYHYRIVAVNGSGASIGKDRTLLTTKVPLSLAILTAPNPVVFGGSINVVGNLSGTGNGGRPVQLQVNSFPFTAGFQNYGNPQLTGPTGGFAFVVVNMTATTSFRVVTTTKPKLTSPVATEGVAVRIDSHIRRTHRRGFARFTGVVKPAEDGQQVAILRIVHGHGRLVGGTVLHHRDATSSRFSKVVRVHPGVYRVLTRIVGAGQISNYGQLLVIR